MWSQLARMQGFLAWQVGMLSLLSTPARVSVAAHVACYRAGVEIAKKSVWNAATIQQ